MIPIHQLNTLPSQDRPSHYLANTRQVKHNQARFPERGGQDIARVVTSSAPQEIDQN